MPLFVVFAITDDPRLRYIGGLAFFTALAAVYSRQWLSMPSQRATRKTAYKLAELLVLMSGAASGNLGADGRLADEPQACAAGCWIR